jgi:hypothetical protein
MPDADPNEQLQDPAEYQPDTRELEASALYDPPETRTYVTEEVYTRTEYINLLSTYSGHRVLDERARKRLFDCVSSLIDTSYGGRIRKAYINELIVTKLRANHG